MKAEDRLLELADRLLNRSREDKVNWKFDERESDYFVKLGFGYLSIALSKNTAAPDVATLGLHKDERNPIVIVEIDETETGFDVLADLYSEADRYVHGWDEALRKLEKMIESGDKIGVDPPHQPVDEDDIPF